MLLSVLVLLHDCFVSHLLCFLVLVFLRVSFRNITNRTLIHTNVQGNKHINVHINKMSVKYKNNSNSPPSIALFPSFPFLSSLSVFAPKKYICMNVNVKNHVQIVILQVQFFFYYFLLCFENKHEGT